MKERVTEQFMRIAEARLRKDYCFGPQRRAVAARMYREWIERKSLKGEGYGVA